MARAAPRSPVRRHQSGDRARDYSPDRASCASRKISTPYAPETKEVFTEIARFFLRHVMGLILGLRVEVLASVQRRRHWPRAEKERIVAAAMEPVAVASEFARAAGMKDTRCSSSARAAIAASARRRRRSPASGNCEDCWPKSQPKKTGGRAKNFCPAVIIEP
jgi:hypothetical protein